MDKLFGTARYWFSHAIGVDPSKGGTHRMTSDDFFAQNTEFFDVIFVDGLHEANQVFRDVTNALKWLNPGDYINPWTGDTWKAAVTLRLIPDIEIVIVDIDQ
eukprot:gene40549-50156_t